MGLAGTAAVVFLRIRFGFGKAAGDSTSEGDAALFTGGVASVHTLTTYLNLASEQFTFSDWRWGWVAGVGVELRISDNISLRSEALCIGVADRTYTFVSPTLGLGNFTHSDSMWLARVGINVKLGFDPAIPTY